MSVGWLDDIINILANVFYCSNLQTSFVPPNGDTIGDTLNIDNLASIEISFSERHSRDAFMTCEELYLILIC